MIHDYSHYRFRSSSCGYLMVNPQGKSNLEKYNDAWDAIDKAQREYDEMSNLNTKTADKKRSQIDKLHAVMSSLEPIKNEISLSETTKKYLLECFINTKYGRRKDITNKYLLKGLTQEESGITVLSRIKHEFFVKNEQHFQNDFIQGTPDIINEGIVYDIKNSWSIFTFWDAKTSSINPIYYWQMMAYLSLTGLSQANLVYTLNDTPDVLIEAEKRKFAYNQGIMEGEIDPDSLAAIERLCHYDDIPIEERIHIIPIERNQEDIDRLHERVVQCREYMNATFNK